MELERNHDCIQTRWKTCPHDNPLILWKILNFCEHIEHFFKSKILFLNFGWTQPISRFTQIISASSFINQSNVYLPFKTILCSFPLSLIRKTSFSKILFKLSPEEKQNANKWWIIGKTTSEFTISNDYKRINRRR